MTIPVTVIVEDGNNAPQSGANVCAFDDTTYIGYDDTSAAHGQVSFTLPQGSYHFRGDYNGTQYGSGANNCTISNCTSASVTMTLPVTVIVQGTSNTAKSGLHVYAFDGATCTGYNAVTDSNGQPVFTLPQGSYRFRADPNDAKFWSAAQNNCILRGCASTIVTVTIPLTVAAQSQTGHLAMLTAPRELASLLLELATTA